MEINANPSFNMFLEQENAEGEMEKVVCVIDKHLKTLVLGEGIKIAKAKRPLEELGIYDQLLP